MSRILLGEAESHNVHLDLDVLLRTRLLIQASSGQGKSWLLRRICEQAFGKVQIIMIDPEGEFSSLRERFGYVLVGLGGETPADPRSAGKVAEKLLELHASAVCDIFELKHNRSAWVRPFLTAMIDAPKRLWHPCLVIVDEAHKFCPERSAGESEASDAMIDLATAGRKRGFAACFATQRLGKLRKDASAELLNRLIGGTFEDLDVERAADELSIPRQERPAFRQEVKTLEPGRFYALGRAVSTERLLFASGPVETTHPEAGSMKHSAGPPPAPASIRDLLPQLADLPAQAEEEARTIDELKREVRTLKGELRTSQVDRARSSAQVKTEELIKRAQVAASKSFGPVRFGYQKMLRERDVLISKLVRHIQSMAELVQTLPAGEEPKEVSSEVTPVPSSTAIYHALPVPEVVIGVDPAVGRSVGFIDGKPVPDLRPGALRMLHAIAMWYPNGVREGQVASQASVKRTGGSFSTYKSNLRVAGLIEDRGGLLVATDAGMAYIGGESKAPRTTDEVLALWTPKLRPGAQRMLKVLIDLKGSALTRSELAQWASVDVEGGSFSTYLSNLRTAGLVIPVGNGLISANREALFL